MLDPNWGNTEDYLSKGERIRFEGYSFPQWRR